VDIRGSKANGICTIQFDRPEKKNAITQAMYQSMADALKDAATDTAVRVIVISGRPEIFTAGNDLEDFLKNPPQGANNPAAQFMQHLSQAEKPVVAAISGAAIGIGTTLLLHCDLVYAADNAKFSMPFTQLGLCPEFGSSLLLQRVAGYQKAAEKLLFGEAFSAQEAADMGIVNCVVPADQLETFVAAQAAKLAALPASSLRTTKRLMKANLGPALASTMAEELKHFKEMLGAPEAKEAITAFFEKRKPDFSKFA
jgi:enoyl-CoA hydratase/carnithine racemase